jgi:hypothetical protein
MEKKSFSSSEMANPASKESTLSVWTGHGALFCSNHDIYELEIDRVKISNHQIEELFNCIDGHRI